MDVGIRSVAARLNRLVRSPLTFAKSHAAEFKKLPQASDSGGIEGAGSAEWSHLTFMIISAHDGVKTLSSCPTIIPPGGRTDAQRPKQELLLLCCVLAMPWCLEDGELKIRVSNGFVKRLASLDAATLARESVCVCVSLCVCVCVFF